MHFGEFNPLEVLATAAIQRGGDVTEGNTNTNPNSSDTELADNNKDTTDDQNNVEKRIPHEKKKDEDNGCEKDLATTNNSTEVTAKDLKPLSVITSSGGSLKSESGTPSYVIKMVTSNGNKVTATRSVMTLKDATKIVIPNKDGSSKTLTVLKINKPLGNKSSIATTIIGEKPKEDDEGYCSRSSLDSPGQCSRSDSELCEQDVSDIKSPSGTVFANTGISKGLISPLNVKVLPSKFDGNADQLKPQTGCSKILSPNVNDNAKKAAKIVIVSKESRQSTTKTVTEKEEKQVDSKFCKPADPVQSSNKGAVLRSLLGEKSSVTVHSPDPATLSLANHDNTQVKLVPSKIQTVIPVDKSKVTNTNDDIQQINSADDGTSFPIKRSSKEPCLKGLNPNPSHCEVKSESVTRSHTGSPSTVNNSDEIIPSENHKNTSNCDSVKSKNISNILTEESNQKKVGVQDNSDHIDKKDVSIKTNQDISLNKVLNSQDIVEAIEVTNKIDVPVTNSEKFEITSAHSKENINNSSTDQESKEMNSGEQEMCNDETNISMKTDEKSKKPNLKRSESFQNAFKTFITSGKPVEVTEIKGATVLTSKNDGNTLLLPQNVLTSLNTVTSAQGGKVTVIAGGPASQLVTSIASQVLATNQSLSQSANQFASQPKQVISKDEITDAKNKPGETNIPLTKESLKLASNVPKVSCSVASASVSGVTNAMTSKSSSVAKTIPVLINTANGKKIANFPVTSLVSANSNSQSQKPVTYLVMPPQGKGASLLLPSQFNKSHLPATPKYQYIIQDDVPPVVSTAVSQSSALNVVNMASSTVVSKSSDSWTLLANVDPQTMIVSTSSAASKSKTVPVLIKKPLSTSTMPTTVVPQSSVLVSSRGPQSLIPRFVAPSLSHSLAGINQANVLVNPNDVLCTQQTSIIRQGESVLNLSQLNNKSLVLNIGNNGSGSQVNINDNCIGNFSEVSSVQSGVQSSHNIERTDQSNQEGDVNESEGSAVVKTDRKSNRNQAGGRNTPNRNGRITPLHSLESSPTENTINIKIHGNKVFDMKTSEELSSNTKKATTNIGKFGALSSSWGGFQKSDSVPSFIGTSLTTSRVSSPVLYDSETTSPSSSVEPWSPNPMSPLQIKSDSELDVESVTRPLPKVLGESSKSGHNYCKRKLRGSTSSTPDLTVMKEGQNTHSGSRLHPLIDHDYCMFSEFSADIQSSIIATTESKKKIERYNQKAKAARTTKESLYKLDKSSIKMKKRKYTHRLPIDDIRRLKQEKLGEKQSPQNQNKAESLDSLLIDSDPLFSKMLKSEKASSKKQAALDKKLLKPRISKRRDGRNYVKITGSFQDDFVYYATKNTRGRPRKYHDSTVPKSSPLQSTTKKAPVGGINVFDWYRDLSKTDKSTRFGVPDNSLAKGDESEKIDPYVNGIDENLNIPSLPQKGGQTPMHESEVADLVMQMMPTDEYNAVSSELLSPSNPSVAQSETVVTSKEKSDKSMSSSDENLSENQNTSESPVDLNDMAEQVRSLLNSLGEAELNMLTEKIGSSDISNSQPVEPVNREVNENAEESSKASNTTVTNVTDSSDYSGLNVFLGPYNQETSSSLPQASNASFDLDDINDSDLLPSDIGNINTILGDLGGNKACQGEASNNTEVTDPKCTPSSLDSPVKNNVALSLLFNDSPVRPLAHADGVKQELPSTSNFAIPKLDKTEYFPEVNLTAKNTAGSSKERNVVQHPPELTVVSMYWNDLPGLMINGKQCVRLVDIHKQMLPAKDTGILKKRCQMMNLEILYCSELERDFLIRYANAAKSKSCVVVAKDDAQALVSFYVNPRPRISSTARQSTSDSRESSAERCETSQSTGVSLSSVCDAETIGITTPKQTGGKNKEKLGLRYNEQTTTPGGGKGKGKGKSSQKRKLSPQSLVIEPSINTTIKHSPGSVGTTQQTSFNQISTQSLFNDTNSVKRSERTRNRKVNYAALNAGVYSDENTELVSSQMSNVEDLEDHASFPDNNVHKPLGSNSLKDQKSTNQKTIKMGSSLLNKVVLIKNSPVLQTNSILNLTVSPVTGSQSLENRYNFQEEIEIRRLRNKQKRRGLNNTDKRKLKRLRERLRVKVKNLKRKIDTLKRNNGLAVSPRKVVIKRMKNVEENNYLSEQSDPIGEELPKVENIGPDTLLRSNELAFQQANNTEIGNSLESDFKNDVSNTEVSGISICHEDNKDENLTSNLQPSEGKVRHELETVNLKCEKTKLNPSPRTKLEVINKGTDMCLRTPNRKIIFPVLHRSNQRGRVQVGNLHFHLYRTKDSSCIQCTTCSDFLSVRKFLKHLHHHNIADELCTVTIPQKLEMAILEPSEEQVYWWGEFEKKRDLFEASPNPAKLSQKSSRSSHDNKDMNSSIKAEQGVNKAGNISVNNNIKTSISQELWTPSTSHLENMPTPVSATRQSKRVRKRKQLHPIESYVYTGKSGQSDNKRLKIEESDTSPVTLITSVNVSCATEFQAAVAINNSDSLSQQSLLKMSTSNDTEHQIDVNSTTNHYKVETGIDMVNNVVLGEDGSVTVG